MWAKCDRGEWRCVIEDCRGFLEAVPPEEDTISSVLPDAIRILEVVLDHCWKAQRLIHVAERWSSVVPVCDVLDLRL